ncbi:hypothetical protein [Bacteroides graminisolvens]|uniref:hypothetical protein n=1 Tax=Bacteroides graminisolvens TaxID=477666 RepID=UPI0029C98585|nr:hypothetical protein [Bacteroides graminisolvens]
MIDIKSKIIPAQPRSKNYPTGTVVVKGGGGNTTVVNQNAGSAIKVIKSLEDSIFTENNVLSSLRTLLEMRKLIIAQTDNETVLSDDNAFSSLRTMEEVNRAIEDVLKTIEATYLNKNKADTANKLITFIEGLISKGLITAESGIKLPSGAALYSAYTDGLLSFAIDENGFVIYEKGTANKWSVITHAGAEFQNLVIKFLAQITDLEVSNKATTLDLVVQALAKTHDLTVDNTADIMHGIIREYLTSESFVSGFLGSGFKIWKDANGDWNGEFDKLTVRKIFTIFELVVQKVVHQGGMVIRSAAGGKLKKVTDGGTYWKCEHDSTDDFLLDDQVLCQTFTGVTVKRYWRKVTSAGAGYFNLSKTDCEAGSATPEVGDDVAVLGNRTNTDRQSAQIDCAVGVNAPYRDDYAGINSYSLVGKLINRTGNLSGITDPDFGVLSGSGLYGSNVYLKGIFRLLSGKTVETEILDAQSKAINTAATDAQSKANAAQSTAISTAANDATSKANTAENNAKTYINSTFTTKTEFSLQFAALNNSILSKVSQTDFNSLNTRVTSAEQKITSDAIISTVSSTITTAKNEAINAAATDATTKANAAKSSAISTAATDATTKANTAESNAKTYSNNTFTPLTTYNTKIAQLESSISLKADSTTVNGINTRLSSAEAKITSDAINFTVQSQVIDTAISYSNLAAKLAGAKMLFIDPAFKESMNSINVYNNNGNGTVTIGRVPRYSDNPTDSNYQIKIVASGFGMTPGRGGFYFGNYAQPYAEYICKFIAWVPTNCSIVFASNSMGSGGYQKWLTPTQGQGKWAEYVSYVRAGDGGNSSTNFYYLNNSTDETVTWWLCYATVFDCSKNEYTPDVYAIKSGISITTGGISIFGQTLSFAGKVTFSSLDSSTQSTINDKATTGYVDTAKSAAISTAATDATTKANSAQSAAISAAATDATTKANNAQSTAISTAATDATTKANSALALAKTYSDTLKNSLGSLAYLNAVSLAKLDSTIVEGGYIKTSLIDANAIITGSLLANKIAATNITTTRLTVSEGCTVGGFSIGSNRIGISASPDNVGSDGMFLYSSMIGFNAGSRQAIIGTYNTLGTSRLGQFIDTTSNYLPNVGIAFDIRSTNNGNRNYAFLGNGNGVLNGFVSGYGFREYSFAANNQYSVVGTLTSEFILVYFNYSNCAIVLPTLASMCDTLGISYTKAFTVRLTVISTAGNSGKLYGRSSSGISGISGYNYPELRDWNNAINNGGFGIDQGDSYELCMFYDGSSTSSVPSRSDAYRAYIINRQN